MNQPATTPPTNPPIVIDPTCGNCCHFMKSATDIGHGMCFALPPGCAFRNGSLVKTRPTMSANERGCTALFMPRPEMMALVEASIPGAANPGNGTLVTE